MKIIAVDNYGRDHVPERFVAVGIPDRHLATIMCDALNAAHNVDHPDYFRVVGDDYVLKPGLEP